MVDLIERKKITITPSGRSTDFISPSFGHGCLFNCSYCYMKRNKPEGLNIATNTDALLDAIDKHVELRPWPKEPNQTHEKFWTYDISCNEDFILHMKYHDWKKILTFFNRHPKAFASMATKYVNLQLLDFFPKNLETGEAKTRVRMSLMPEMYRRKLEKNTSQIVNRIKFINQLKRCGYDVHINFSPVIVYPGALKLYEELFKEVDFYVEDKYKNDIFAEVIFLTHNEDKHEYNLEHELPGEELLWRPFIQERKISGNGKTNLRYNRHIKRQLVREFRSLHDSIIPWNKIRYIF